MDELAIACMARNGFDYAGPKRETGTIDLAPGLEGEEELEAIGSGIVAFEIWRLDHAQEGLETIAEMSPDTEESPESSVDEAFWETLHVSVTVDGETVAGGCARWGEDEYLRLHPEFRMRLELLEAYGSHMQVAFEDIRVKKLQEEWSTCMATEGFPGYHTIGDQSHDIVKRVEALLAAGSDRDTLRSDLEALKQYDIAATLAAATCWEQIAERREEILSEYADTFSDAYREEINQITVDG